MKANSAFDRAASIVLAAAAVVMAATYLLRPGPAESGGQSSPTSVLTKHYPEWRDWMREAVVIGDRNAPVVILEFADLECVGCKAFMRQSCGQ